MHTVLSQKEKFKGNKLKTFLRKKLYLYQNRKIKKYADKVVVHSGFFKDLLIKEYKFPKDKIVVLTHAIIENLKKEEKAKAKKELNLFGNVYLLIGTMIPDHGHDIVVNQADKIGKTILIATNPSKINYKNAEKIKKFLQLNEEIVEKNHFEKFVRFDVGDISYDKWWKYFSASDLILLPYRGGIGSGIFADAMAMEKPVIASNVPYFKQIAKEYGCLEIAKTDKDFPQTIKKSINPKNYKKMLDECKRFFDENNLTVISKKYKELYNSLK